MTKFDELRNKANAREAATAAERRKKIKADDEYKKMIGNSSVQPHVDKLMEKADEAEGRLVQLYEFTDSYLLAQRVRDHLIKLGFKSTYFHHETKWSNPDLLISSGYTVTMEW